MIYVNDLCGREKYINVLFTKGTEEWNNLIYIIKDIVCNIYNITRLYSNDYSYIIMIYHFINSYDDCNWIP